MAREMIRLSGFSPGVDMDIRITGARPGEKLFEELFTTGEERKSRVHPKVFEAQQDHLDRALLDHSLHTLQNLLAYPGRGRQREMLECFQRLVPSYRPSPTGLGRYLPGAGPVVTQLDAAEKGRNDLSAIA